MKMKGYKVLNPDWTCRWKQYGIGKFEEDIKDLRVCENGMHFCKRAIDCFNYYSFDPRNKVAEVIAYGNVKEDSDKCCTDKLEIVREIPWAELLNIVNIGIGNTGKGNSGNHNSGDYNSGYCNSGYYNSGSYNSGSYNSGSYNSGNCNSGSYNRGNYNSGSYNSGYYNSGDFNLSNGNNGCFNTQTFKIMMFNKMSDMTLDEWRDSKAYDILCQINANPCTWINSSYMTEDEKKAHPEHITIGGYLRKNDVKKAYQEWWDKLSDQEKDIIKAIPNFDAKIFERITGVKEEHK